MPLVERFTDWDGANLNGTHDDPSTLDFDHRVDATEKGIAQLSKDAVKDALKNTSATCLIIPWDLLFGWRQEGGNWVYDPAGATSPAKYVNCLSRQYEQDGLDAIRKARKLTVDGFSNPGQPRMNLADASRDAEGPGYFKRIEGLEWPPDGTTPAGATTQLISRFNLNEQYLPGATPGSGYHLGNGYVGTAGHCVATQLLENKFSELRVLFNWTGDVKGKKFSSKELFEIESVVFCDAPGKFRDNAPEIEVARWARRWDTAIFKLKGAPADFAGLGVVDIDPDPPKFGTPIYNIGAPLGTPFKVSPKAHVLRHSLFDGDENPFSHKISGYGTYTTELDQFGGNSGGPVFNGDTGKLVGHTVSSQDEPANASNDEMKKWELEYLSKSKNYSECEAINKYLEVRLPEKEDPTFGRYRVNPLYLRTVLADSVPMISNVTHICPGDYPQNKKPNSADTAKVQPPNKYEAVFSRHHFASRDVYFRNVSGRVDRNRIFMTPLDSLANDFAGFSLEVKLVGPNTFKKPDANSTLVLAVKNLILPIDVKGFDQDKTSSTSTKSVYTAKMDLKAAKNLLPKSPGANMLSWDKVRLEQRIDNPPTFIGVTFTVHRAALKFPANASWPPLRPDVTGDASLVWPAEDFVFATTVGDSVGKLRTDALAGVPVTREKTGDLWHWIADFDRVWSNPKQHSDPHGAATLLDPVMSDIDKNVA